MESVLPISILALVFLGFGMFMLFSVVVDKNKEIQELKKLNKEVKDICLHLINYKNKE